MTDADKAKQVATEVAHEVVNTAVPTTQVSTETLTARQDCYKRIIEHTKNTLTAYYTRYPERATDERGRDGQDWLIRGLRDGMHILDEYDIEYKDGGKS